MAKLQCTMESNSAYILPYIFWHLSEFCPIIRINDRVSVTKNGPKIVFSNFRLPWQPDRQKWICYFNWPYAKHMNQCFIQICSFISSPNIALYIFSGYLHNYQWMWDTAYYHGNKWKRTNQHMIWPKCHIPWRAILPAYFLVYFSYFFLIIRVNNSKSVTQKRARTTFSPIFRCHANEIEKYGYTL